MNNMKMLIDMAMNNPNISKNPIAKNAIEMYKNGNTNGINELANNLCKEKGISPDEITKKVKSMFGM